jgi:signal transduction histidine kinase
MGEGGDGGARGADHVEWRVEGADVPQFGMARKEELREVLLNVFENARHASARHVTVRVHSDENGGQPRVKIAVHDDGSGIPDDVLPRIFEPHFSTRTSGSGLGLAISRRLIDGWGGEIKVSSRFGEGTVVEIGLRYADTQGAGHKAEGPGKD